MPSGQHQQPSLWPARFVCGMWIGYCVILYATYTANLAASLTVPSYKLPFNSLEEMVAQTEYQYGFLNHIVLDTVLEVMLEIKLYHYI